MKNFKLLPSLFFGVLLFTTSCSSDDSEDTQDTMSNLTEETTIVLTRNAISGMSANAMVTNNIIDFDNCPGTIMEFSFENETDGLYNNTTFAIAGSFSENTTFNAFINERADQVNTMNGTSYTADDFVLHAIAFHEILENNTMNTYYLIDNNDIIDYYEDCSYEGDVLPTNSPLYTGACYNPQILYPFGVEVEDLTTGDISVVTVNDELEFYMLLDTPTSESNILPLDLSYPINLEDYDGNIITANNIDELNEALISEICIE